MGDVGNPRRMADGQVGAAPGQPVLGGASGATTVDVPGGDRRGVVSPVPGPDGVATAIGLLGTLAGGVVGDGVIGDGLGTAPVAPRAEPRCDAVDGVESSTIRRRELGAFLRSRRERISPTQVGLVPGARRRTPGLRREEVAQLAGVGVTWYTWLEQGRDIRASEQVLDAIARTLLFDGQERTHLFTLAGLGNQGERRDCQVLAPAVQVVLDQLDPYPASVQNARFDILAFNRSYGGLVEDLNLIPEDERNTMWLAFTHPAWRRAMVEWEDTVARMVAQLRAAMAEHLAEPTWKGLLRRLTDASPEFAEMWNRHDVQGPENRTKLLECRRNGLLRLDHTSLWFGRRMGVRLVIYTPADADTRARLERMASRAA